MVEIPNIKIPSVRVGSIGFTSNIGACGATPAPPTPITYLTQWEIVGNSEVQGQEIWSCGEYNATDGKYHILVQPQGGSKADIALDAPLRKVNNVADTIEFPSDTDGKALVTRNLKSVDMGSYNWNTTAISSNTSYRMINKVSIMKAGSSLLCAEYTNTNGVYQGIKGITCGTGQVISVYDPDYNQLNSAAAFKAHVDGLELIHELATPTTELVDAPQIEEAESHTCVISQGGKAVEWSSFTTNSG